MRDDILCVFVEFWGCVPINQTWVWQMYEYDGSINTIYVNQKNKFYRMLSQHLIPPKPPLQDSQFSTITASCKKIRVIDRIRPTFYFISELYLDHNMLVTLNGIQQFQNLQILSINFNAIACLSELNKINNKFFIHSLAFIGNPMEAHIKANLQGLKHMGFHGLKVLNQVHERGQIWGKVGTKVRDFETEEGRTERYQPKYTDLELKRSRKQTTYTITRPTKHNFSTANPNPKSDTQHQTISTRINNSQDPTSFPRSNPHKSPQSQSKRPTRARVNSEKTVTIQPFREIDEEVQTEEKWTVEQRWKGRRRYGKGEDQGEDEYEGKGVDEESSISSNQQGQSFGYFNQTGHFDHLHHRSQELGSIATPTRHRRFVMQFLEEQKLEIAEAFRKRCLKEKAFGIWIKEWRQVQQDEQSAKRKAWAALRIFRTMEHKR